MARNDRARGGSRRQTRSSAAIAAQAEGRKGWIKIAAVLGAVVAFAAFYISIASSRRDLDAVTLCPATPDSVTVLLVDVTDPMNAAQRQDFANQLTKLKNQIPRYGKLIVAKVDATSERLLAPVITRCNPGTQADETNATGNPAALQKRWDEGFDRPLTRAFDGLAGASGAEQSPILESIQSVALTELQKPGLEDKPKRLVVASDLLQNTEDLSFYRELPDGRAFVSSTPFRRVRTDLRGVEVELWMLERADAATTQGGTLARLWERIIDAEGGELERIYNVSG